MKVWYAVRTQVRAEERAVMHLTNQGYEVYLPRYRKRRRHARKIDTVLRPLFPGYLFVRIDDTRQQWHPINGTIGVLSLVQFGAKPLAVDDAVMAAIQHSEDEAGAVSITPKGLKKGDSVRVDDGAFADCVGMLEEVDDEKRVVLLLDVMGRQVRVSTPMEFIASAS